MVSTIAYDGRISGAAIATALDGTVSGAMTQVIPYANGQRILIIACKT